MKKLSRAFSESEFLKSKLKGVNSLIIIVFFVFATGSQTICQAQTETTQNIKLTQNKNTSLTKGGFLKEKTHVNLEKRLLSIDLESILEPYKNRPGAQQWIGEHIGKFLHAAVLEYQHSGHQELKKRIGHAAQELINTQLADGYLGTYEEKDRWTSWDVWSHKYNMIGLLAYYDLTKDAKALAACEKMASLLSTTFGEGKKDIIASGTHVGMAPTSILEPMVKLYTVTGKKEHLQFCKYLVASWEQENGPKLISSLLEHGNVRNTANHKAYEMMSCLVGLLDLYKITGEEDYRKAVENAWADIVNNRLYINGTTSHTEHFQEDHSLSPTGYYADASRFCGPGEGCVSVTWLQMNMRLLEITGEQKYMQQIENTVYNAILPAQSPLSGEVAYHLPLTGRKRYGEVTHGIMPDICCCSSSIPRGMALIANQVFGHVNEAPIIMLLTAAKTETYLVSQGKQIPVALGIETDFPKSGNAKLTLTSSEKSIKNASILFNIPEWANEYTIKIEDEIFEAKPGSILDVKRNWKNGDVLHIEIGLPIVKVIDNNKESNLVALKRGPQLLATDNNISDIEGLPKWGWKGDQLYKLSVLNDNAVSEMLLVPFSDAGQSFADYDVLFPDFELLQAIEPSSRKKYVQQLSEFNFLHGQVKTERETLVYKNTLRNQVPDNWYLTAPAMIRVTLKKDNFLMQLSLDSLKLNAQLDTIVKQGYTAIELFATPHGGKSFGGLDAIDRYEIDPEVGSMDDFKRLVRQAHRKHLAVIAFDNFGYSSVDAPHFLKACQDISKGITSNETKWFNWADSSSAKPPMTPDNYYLGGSRGKKWVFSPIAKKYYWSKWKGFDKDGKPCSLPQYDWSTEWQQEVKNIVKFWMNTGIDGMVVDAVNWYTNYTWQMGKECITDIIASYGNTFIQPEGAGGFYEDPVPWITEGGWNCVQDYGLGIWWEKETHILNNAIENNNPTGLEEALQNYHDRVVADNGILYIGADFETINPDKYHLYVAFSIATGHLYCKMYLKNEKFEVDKSLAQILQIKKNHPAFGQLGRRQKLKTNEDKKFYAFIQKANNNSERILCVFNFQSTQHQITIDLSGINATSLIDLSTSKAMKYTKKLQTTLPAYGYAFYSIH